MARTLANTDALRGVTNANLAGRATAGGSLTSDEAVELAQYRAENAQLHQLCAELEQALHEASQHSAGAELEARVKECEILIDEKTQTICELHQQLQEARSLYEELENTLKRGQPDDAAPVPCEEELLALSEELERERRQLQEDEQSLMDQMRDMEVGMARERAEMARQRNDLQRLHSEIRHEIERLERNGALQSKIENLKTKLQDATARRGAAPAQSTQGQPPPNQPTPVPQTKSTSIMGRLFGK